MFDVCEPETFEPRAYIQAMRDAAANGYDVIVLDSLSHAWEGEGGILDQVDKRGGRFEAWKDMSPQTRELIDAILTYPGHVIATMRTKTEWVVEKNDRGKSEPRKVGLAPKFKEGLEYEFDVVGTLDDDNVLHVSKSRASALNKQVIAKPGKQFADALRAWLDDGAEAPAPQKAPARPRATTPAPRKRLRDVTTGDELHAWCVAEHDRMTATRDEARAEAVNAVRARAVACEVDPAVALEWAGLHFDPSSGEVAEAPDAQQ